jgi:protein involved in polysaccharide export with SLBB domain
MTNRILNIMLLILLTIISADPAGANTIDEYTVDEGDILSINVYSHDDMTTRVRVSGKGSVTFPLLGTIEVVDLTTQQISEKLTAALADGYLINPQVNVFIEEFRVQNVYISGQIEKPDAYQYKIEMTLIKVITLAGGFTDLASKSKVRIVRMVDGEEITINKAKMDEAIQPGDVIIVPESFF